MRVPFDHHNLSNGPHQKETPSRHPASVSSQPAQSVDTFDFRCRRLNIDVLLLRFSKGDKNWEKVTFQLEWAHIFTLHFKRLSCIELWWHALIRSLHFKIKYVLWQAWLNILGCWVYVTIVIECDNYPLLIGIKTWLSFWIDGEEVNVWWRAFEAITRTTRWTLVHTRTLGQHKLVTLVTLLTTF